MLFSFALYSSTVTFTSLSNLTVSFSVYSSNLYIITYSSSPKEFFAFPAMSLFTFIIIFPSFWSYIQLLFVNSTYPLSCPFVAINFVACTSTLIGIFPLTVGTIISIFVFFIGKYLLSSIFLASTILFSAIIPVTSPILNGENFVYSLVTSISLLYFQPMFISCSFAISTSSNFTFIYVPVNLKLISLYKSAIFISSF